MERTAVVVGSGPNGLAAAITLARAGMRVTVLEAADSPGGGTRTEELTLPGYRHDVCSAFHPLGSASPFFRSIPLEDHGLRWIRPEVQLAHPLDGGDAAVVYQSVERTVARLGDDADRWRADIAAIGARWDVLAELVLGPVLRVPRHPIFTARFGVHAILPAATYIRRRLATDHGRAIFAGIAAHSLLPLERPMTASFGLVLGALAHVHGWPVAAGGSNAITNAMLRYLGTLGGELITGHRVTSTADLPASDVTIFDTSPGIVAEVYDHALPKPKARRLRRFRYGPGAFKVDIAASEPIPWDAEDVRQAGTVHLGGTWEEVAAAEREVAEGVTPERPFVVVGQQSVIDPSRTPDDGHTVWAYCHVPAGSSDDMSAAIIDQIERFAPGFRTTIRKVHTMKPADLETHNANYVGGDIGSGSHSPTQLVLRGGRDPYRVGVRGVYLCSASTPPGAGVHGMGGWHAARAALNDLHSGASTDTMTATEAGSGEV